MAWSVGLTNGFQYIGELGGDGMDKIVIPKTNIVSKLWTGSCAIMEYQDVTNPITHQTTSKLVTVVENEPCRLSYSTEPVANLSNGLATVAQVIKLFIRADLKLKAGSKLKITQHGVTNNYVRASEPSIYTNHQEVVLQLDKEV